MEHSEGGDDEEGGLFTYGDTQSKRRLQKIAIGGDEEAGESGGDVDEEAGKSHSLFTHAGFIRLTTDVRRG